jgi:hypothetical protein
MIAPNHYFDLRSSNSYSNINSIEVCTTYNFNNPQNRQFHGDWSPEFTLELENKIQSTAKSKPYNRVFDEPFERLLTEALTSHYTKQWRSRDSRKN